ncbi:MAG TPA: TIM barrel protein [Candidatus Limnocylindria bacterium]|jgi:inosose dehydratase
MNLANAPVSWGVSEATGGRQPASAAMLGELAAAGYTGTELGPLGYLPSDPDGLREALAAHDIALVGAFCPVTLHDPARADASIAAADEVIALLAAAGAAVLVLAEAGDAARRAVAGRVPIDGSAGFDDAAWARFAAGAEAVARRAAERGLITAFHPHAATYVETPAEVDTLMARTDPSLVRLCLDTGHAVYGGGDPVAIARRHGSRVQHVHLKDVRRSVLGRAAAGELDFAGAVAAGVFAPLGAGDVDLRGTLAVLRDIGYDGWLVVEQDRVVGPGDAPGAARDDAARSFAFLQDALGGNR